jgi:hypothetical protein
MSLRRENENSIRSRHVIRRRSPITLCLAISVATDRASWAPARESRKLAIHDEPVQRRWMNPLHQGLTRFHQVAVLAESFEGSPGVACLAHIGYY